MAATGGEAASRWDLFGSESLWIPAGGAAREEEGSEKKEKKKRRKISKPGSTSKVMKWTVTIPRAFQG